LPGDYPGLSFTRNDATSCSPGKELAGPLEVRLFRTPQAHAAARREGCHAGRKRILPWPGRLPEQGPLPLLELRVDLRE